MLVNLTPVNEFNYNAQVKGANYSTMKGIVKVLRGIEDDVKAYLCESNNLELILLLIEHTGQAYIEKAVDTFINEYAGEYASPEAYAEEFYNDCYNEAMNAIPTMLVGHIDWQGVARDMDYNGELLFIQDSGFQTHVFYNRQ